MLREWYVYHERHVSLCRVRGDEKLRIKCHETTSEVNWCRIKRTELNESAGIMGVLHHWDILNMSSLFCHVSGNIVVITENILCTSSC